MYHELQGSVRSFVGSCADNVKAREFDLGFGFTLKVRRLHGHGLQRFHLRLNDGHADDKAPQILLDLIEDVGICQGVLIIETQDSMFVYGSPYELDLDKPWSALENLRLGGFDLKMSLSKFGDFHFTAAGFGVPRDNPDRY